MLRTMRHWLASLLLPGASQVVEVGGRGSSVSTIQRYRIFAGDVDASQELKTGNQLGSAWCGAEH